MFDKLRENALAQYMPGITRMTEVKRAELAEMRAKVRITPEEVEAWFDKEIAKLTDENIKSLIRVLKDNGPSTATSLGTDSSK